MSRAATAVALGLAVLSLASCGSDSEGPSASVGLAPVALTKGPPLTASLTIRNCLNAHGYQLRSGSVPAGDADAPDAAVFFNGTDKGTAGEIGIYATQAEAHRKLGKIRADAKSSGVVVVPQGLATTIYYSEPTSAAREDVGRCLFRANAA